MENQELNIAEILKDKPKGIKLWSPLFGNVTLKGVDTSRVVLPILTKAKWEDTQKFTKEGHFYCTYKDVECMLFPSKEMRDWEKFAWKKGDVLKAGVDNLCFFDSWESDNYTEFHAKFATPHYSGETFETKVWAKETNEDIIKQYISKIEEIKGGKLNLSTLEIEKKPEFKDGDILTCNGFIFIFKMSGANSVYFHVSCDTENKDCTGFNADIPFSNSFIKDFKYATEEEKQRLFDALAKEGKTWDSDKKAIVDLPNEEKKCEFNPMDWCLMRTSYRVWNLCQYAFYRKDFDMFVSVGGNMYDECIPYNEETKHLLGTTKSGKKVRNESEIG